MSLAYITMMALLLWAFMRIGRDSEKEKAQHAEIITTRKQAKAATSTALDLPDNDDELLGRLSGKDS